MLRYEPSANDMLRVRRVPGSEFLGKRSGYIPSKYFDQIYGNKKIRFNFLIFIW